MEEIFSIYLSERRKHFSEGDVFFQNAPPFHIAGLTFMSCYLHTKKTMVLYTPTSVVPYLLKAKQYKVGKWVAWLEYVFGWSYLASHGPW